MAVTSKYGRLIAKAIEDGALKSGNEIHKAMEPKGHVISIPSPLNMATIIIRCINECLPDEVE